MDPGIAYYGSPKVPFNEDCCALEFIFQILQILYTSMGFVNNNQMYKSCN